MSKLEELAQKLYDAYKNNQPMDMKECEGILDDYGSAYAVQDMVIEKKGSPVLGYKISLTSKTTQDMFYSKEPLYGQQIGSRIVNAPCTIDRSTLNEPLIEIELVMVPKVDLHSGMTDDELLDSVTVAGDMEIPDARFKNWFPALHRYLVVADCAVGGYIVCGKPVDGKELTVEGLNKIHVELTHNGKVIREGDSSEVLDNPIHALKWLVEALARKNRVLKAGTKVSTGTFFVPPHLEKGSYNAHFTGALSQDVSITVA